MAIMSVLCITRAPKAAMVALSPILDMLYKAGFGIFFRASINGQFVGYSFFNNTLMDTDGYARKLPL